MSQSMNYHKRYLIWPVEGGCVVRDTERDHEIVSDVMSKADAQKEARKLNADEGDIKIPRIRGSKWLRECSYIPPHIKHRVVQAIEECREEFPDEPVMIRPASYIGPDDNSRVVVCYGLGQRIFRSI